MAHVTLADPVGDANQYQCSLDVDGPFVGMVIHLLRSDSGMMFTALGSTACLNPFRSVELSTAVSCHIKSGRFMALSKSASRGSLRNRIILLEQPGQSWLGARKHRTNPRNDRTTVFSDCGIPQAPKRCVLLVNWCGIAVVRGSAARTCRRSEVRRRYAGVQTPPTADFSVSYVALWLLLLDGRYVATSLHTRIHRCDGRRRTLTGDPPTTASGVAISVLRRGTYKAQGQGRF